MQTIDELISAVREMRSFSQRKPMPDLLIAVTLSPAGETILRADPRTTSETRFKAPDLAAVPVYVLETQHEPIRLFYLRAELEAHLKQHQRPTVAEEVEQLWDSLVQSGPLLPDFS